MPPRILVTSGVGSAAVTTAILSVALDGGAAMSSDEQRRTAMR